MVKFFFGISCIGMHFLFSYKTVCSVACTTQKRHCYAAKLLLIFFPSTIIFWYFKMGFEKADYLQQRFVRRNTLYYLFLCIPRKKWIASRGNYVEI